METLPPTTAQATVPDNANEGCVGPES